MKNRTAKRIKGGSCTAMSTGQYGTTVFGAAGQQQAASGQGNLIASNVPPMIGGKRRGRKGKGGSAIADLGVPLVLLGINQAMTCRRRRGKGGKKSSKRRSFRRRR